MVVLQLVRALGGYGELGAAWNISEAVDGRNFEFVLDAGLDAAEGSKVAVDSSDAEWLLDFDWKNFEPIA